jgi:hypothetical protein
MHGLLQDSSLQFANLSLHHGGQGRPAGTVLLLMGYGFTVCGRVRDEQVVSRKVLAVQRLLAAGVRSLRDERPPFE